MKRIFKSPQAPEGLRKFAEENPYETWEASAVQTAAATAK